MVTKRVDGSWTKVEFQEDDLSSFAIGIANYGQRTRRNKVDRTTPILPTPVREENIPTRITEEAA